MFIETMNLGFVIVNLGNCENCFFGLSLSSSDQIPITQGADSNQNLNFAYQQGLLETENPSFKSKGSRACLTKGWKLNVMYGLRFLKMAPD